MFRGASIVLATLLVSLLLVGCSVATTSPFSGDDGDSSAGRVSAAATEAEDIGDLQASLAQAGLDVGPYRQDRTELEQDAIPLFEGAPLRPFVLDVGATHLSVYHYEEPGKAARVAGGLDSNDPFPFIDFKGRPHVLASDSAIVLFVEHSTPTATPEQDALILQVLRKSLGPDYAVPE